MAGVAVTADAAGERFEVEFQVADGSWQREPLSSCHGTRFEDALLARPFRFEKGLQSFAGWWYFATTGTHVGFESWLERDHLMLMDFDPGVRAVASQPFWLRWRDEDDHVRRHAPDFFARRHDGRAVVVDVRPDDRIPERDEHASILPDVDGTRFALAGLSAASGESHLHVISAGMPHLTDRFAHNWTPGFSSWLRDGAGNWHVAMADEPCTFGDGMQAFRLRLTPPLVAVPGLAEVVVTGPTTRARATISMRPAPGTSEA
jgi:hypothetical protein